MLCKTLEFPHKRVGFRSSKICVFVKMRACILLNQKSKCFGLMCTVNCLLNFVTLGKFLNFCKSQFLIFCKRINNLWSAQYRFCRHLKTVSSFSPCLFSNTRHISFSMSLFLSFLFSLNMFMRLDRFLQFSDDKYIFILPHLSCKIFLISIIQLTLTNRTVNYALK